MATIDYKQKIKDYMNSSEVDTLYKSMLNNLFPELKESGDEKIRKWIRKELESKYVVDNIVNNEMADKALAWLEKQGPKPQGKSALEAAKEEKVDNQNCVKPDKIEPKFKVGDWVVCEAAPKFAALKTGDIVQISNKETLKLFLMFESCFRLWDITKDAKAGDVLACPNDAGDRDVVFIFKNINSDEGWVFCFCASDANGCFCTNNDYVGNSNSTNISPATKEQRDLLFKKMHEAGYEWDAEKKELKRNEQKTVWSEEDSGMVDDIVKSLKKYQLQMPNYRVELQMRWLKSLKDRYTWKPSEYELIVLKRAAEKDGACLMGLYQQLKKLRGE